VIILHQGAKRLGPSGPMIALGVALAFPILYGAHDYWSRKKPNWISLVGIINVGITGSFALFHLSGHWFWLKEAAFPLIIGFAIFIGNRFGQPFLKGIFWNDRVFQTERISGQLSSPEPLNRLFKQATDLFSLSFFISAAANFFIATKVFVPIDMALSVTEREAQLNAQIAQMTWKAYLIVAMPMMVFSGFVLWFVVRRLQSMTGLKVEDLLIQDQPQRSSSDPSVST
jgi:hypothetical protein